MQIFLCMVYIWNAYEKEAESCQNGISKHAGFKYPPILPIVYYEGKGVWTVPLDFRNRVCRGEEFGKYIPDFRYYLVPLRDYSNEELMAKKDEGYTQVSGGIDCGYFDDIFAQSQCSGT